MWQCMGDVRPNSAAGLSVLGLRAASAASFATLYIFFGSPISGIGGLSRDAPLTREMINKAFHDTAVGQTIGISFTPLFHELFDAVCLGGGAIEEAFFDSADAALRQEWEVGAATLYVVLVTPIMAGLYHSLVHVPKAEKKAEGQNASAAAGAEGDGGGDGGGDDGGGGGDGGDGGD